MTDKEYIDNLTIWCSYHDDRLIDEYNLDYIPSYIQLFNTNNLLLRNDNINYLSKYFCEICAMYYVWKNQIYSKYIGFCHYRRFFSNLNKENIEKIGFNCHMLININIKSYCKGYTYFNMNTLYKYLCNTKKFDINKLNEYFYGDSNINIPWKLSYICTWDIFNKICELYFGFLSYIFENFKDINNYCDRWPAWESEAIIGIIIALIFDNNALNFGNYDFFDHPIITKTDDINKAIRWIKKNNRTNAYLYIISNKFNIDDLQNIYNYAECIIILPNEHNIKDTNILKLNVNEYIKCLDPIEFKKGNYTIEKFNNI